MNQFNCENVTAEADMRSTREKMSYSVGVVGTTDTQGFVWLITDTQFNLCPLSCYSQN